MPRWQAQPHERLIAETLKNANRFGYTPWTIARAGGLREIRNSYTASALAAKDRRILYGVATVMEVKASSLQTEKEKKLGLGPTPR
jgi:hypothetical protein